MEARSKIVLNALELLVSPLDDYYTNNAGDNRFNATISENQSYDVGIIEHGGEDIPEEWIGCVIYYIPNGQLVSLPGIGKYWKINSLLKHLIRLDQNITNYKEK